MIKIPNWLLNSIVFLGAVLLIVISISQIYGIRNKVKNLDDKHNITISSEGRITVVPDIATVNASVMTFADTALNAQTQNTAKMNDVIGFVKSQKVSDADIKTSSYNIYPQYNYDKGSRRLTGYNANQTLTIKIRDLKAVGTILDGLTKNGVNSVQGVNYGFNDPDGPKQQAREKALANAKDKAQRLASVAGLKLGKLVTFSETSFSNPYPVAYDAKYGFGGAAPEALPSTQVEPGSQEVTAQISVTYELR